MGSLGGAGATADHLVLDVKYRTRLQGGGGRGGTELRGNEGGFVECGAIELKPTHTKDLSEGLVDNLRSLAPFRHTNSERYAV